MPPHAVMGDPPAISFLLTRPAWQGMRFAAALRRRFPGVEVVESPLLLPVLMQPDLPQGLFDAVVFTSETGVASAGPYRARLPRLAFCVGNRTSEAAREVGFDARSAAGDAEALVALLVHLRLGRLIHLHGAETRGDVAGRLNAAGIETIGVVTYRQEAQPLTLLAQALLQGGLPVVAPVFSPRTARLLSQAAVGARAPIWLAALSDAVAEALQLPTARRIVAGRPDADAMLAAIEALLDTTTRA
jgi:uroporphyrinogen-III synthase